MSFKVLAQDREAGVTKVFFFVGQPEENKPPKGVKLIPAAPVDGRKMVWVAKVPLPEDKKGPTEVSVQVVNAVGLSTFETTSVDLLRDGSGEDRAGENLRESASGPVSPAELGGDPHGCQRG